MATRKSDWGKAFRTAGKEIIKLSKPKKRTISKRKRRKYQSGVDYMRKDVSRARGRLAVAAKETRARAKAFKIKHFEKKRKSIYDL